MTRAPADPLDDDLPEAVFGEVADAALGEPAARATRLSELKARHPEHAVGIDKVAAAISGSDRLLAVAFSHQRHCRRNIGQSNGCRHQRNDVPHAPPRTSIRRRTAPTATMSRSGGASDALCPTDLLRAAVGWEARRQRGRG